mmetsp:Transcript_14564/g.25617  ORF Transcript_14564/g.25617 Transcript_14564/m.25617 type:complete len:466 (-) Transcript_14564:159-1556(-)
MGAKCSSGSSTHEQNTQQETPAYLVVVAGHLGAGKTALLRQAVRSLNLIKEPARYSSGAERIRTSLRVQAFVADLLCDLVDCALHALNDDSPLGRMLHDVSLPPSFLQTLLEDVQNLRALLENMAASYKDWQDEATANPDDGITAELLEKAEAVKTRVELPQLKPALQLAFDELFTEEFRFVSHQYFLDSSHLSRILSADYEATETDIMISQKQQIEHVEVEVGGCKMVFEEESRLRRRHMQFRNALYCADAYVMVINLTTYAHKWENYIHDFINYKGPGFSSFQRMRLYLVFTHADLMKKMMVNIPVTSVQYQSGAMKGRPLWPDFKGSTVEDAARYFSDKILHATSNRFKSVAQPSLVVNALELERWTWGEHGGKVGAAAARSAVFFFFLHASRNINLGQRVRRLVHDFLMPPRHVHEGGAELLERLARDLAAGGPPRIEEVRETERQEAEAYMKRHMKRPWF